MEFSPMELIRKNSIKIQEINFLLEDVLIKEFNALQIREDELINEAELISECMAKNIRIIEDDNLRKKLINIRRKLYQKKLLTIEEEQLIANSLPNLSLNIKMYIEKLKKNLEKRESISNLFDYQTKKELVFLKKLYKKNELLKNNLVLTNEKIVEKLDRFIHTPVAKQNRSIRKVDSVLFKFATRAALKCSPFASLTYTGIRGINYTNKQSKKIFANANNALISKIFDEICKNQKVRENLSYTLNPMFTKQGDNFTNTILVNSSKSTLYKTKPIFKKYNGLNIFMNVVDVFSLNNFLAYENLVNTLKIRLNISDELETKKILNYLIDESILISTEKLNENSNNMLQELNEFISIKEYPNIIIVESLLKLQIKIEKLSNLNLDRIGKIYNLMEFILQELNIQFSERKDFLYFDGIDFNKNDNNVPSLPLDKLRDSFIKYQTLIMAFDTEIKRQFIMAQYFREEYGKEYVPKNKFEALEVLKKLGGIEELQSKEFTNMYFGHYDFSNFKSQCNLVNELHNIGQLLINNLLGQLEDKEIVLEDKEIDSLISKIKKITGQRDLSYALFLQVGNQSNQYMLNHIYPGFGTFSARFLNYFNTQDNKLSRYTDKYINQKGIIDIYKSFGFNANVRKLASNRKFVLPYDIPNEEDLSFNDVMYVYDNNSQLLSLIDKRTQKVIKPQFLGSLLITATPPPTGMLNTLSSHSTLFSDLGEILIKQLPNTDENITHIPRISIGSVENLVVSREKWKINSEQILHLKDKDLSKYWSNVVTYFSKNNLPFKFYIRSFVTNMEEWHTKTSSRKPQFINLSSPGLFKVFLQTVSKNNSVILEEENPQSNSSSYATEFLIELSK
ncbi:lantibiotic dehydratase [Priestia aryabhattai]